MPDPVWEYSDEMAQMQKRIEALETAVNGLLASHDGMANVLHALKTDHEALKAAIQRMADYQGVAHLLRPQ